MKQYLEETPAKVMDSNSPFKSTGKIVIKVSDPVIKEAGNFYIKSLNSNNKDFKKLELKHPVYNIKG